MKTQKLWILLFVLAIVLCGCTQNNAHQDATVLLPIECISQHPHFPTGCESVATVMALHHLGENISIEDFILHHLPMNNDFYYQNGELIGPDPNRFFIGDPHTTNSYGCFAPVIEQALISYFGNDERVTNTSGMSLDTLCRRYIASGLPVILWAGIRMEPIKDGASWLLENGKRFVWPSGEHCVLLVGYSDTHYYINDPYAGEMCAYEKSTIEQRYREMNMQSIVIVK